MPVSVAPSGVTLQALQRQNLANAPTNPARSARTSRGRSDLSLKIPSVLEWLSPYSAQLLPKKIPANTATLGDTREPAMLAWRRPRRFPTPSGGWPGLTLSLDRSRRYSLAVQGFVQSGLLLISCWVAGCAPSHHRHAGPKEGHPSSSHQHVGIGRMRTASKFSLTEESSRVGTCAS